MARYGAAILTIAGTIVGAYFGYPALGAALGSLAGSLLFTPKGTNTTGPLLADITQTTSSVGVNIPRGWGTFAVAGTFVAQSSLREVMVSQSQGGKGATGSSTTTTPTYFQDFAILINDSGPPENPRPLKGVRTMWANGKAIYDRRPRNATETDATYSQRLAASDQLEGQFTLYLGTEDQMPDPTLEATYGVGGISGFRGCAYIVFINWQNKAEDGNRIPATWLFECYTEGESAAETLTEYANEQLYPWINGDPPLNPAQIYTYEAQSPVQGGGNDPTPQASIEAALALIPQRYRQGGGIQYIDYNPHADITGSNNYATSKTEGFLITDDPYREAMAVLLHYNDVGPVAFKVDPAMGGGGATDTCALVNTPHEDLPVREAYGASWNGPDNEMNGAVYGLSASVGLVGPAAQVSFYNPLGWDSVISCSGGGNFDLYISYDCVLIAKRSGQPPPDPCDSTPARPVALQDGSFSPGGAAAQAQTVAGLDGYVVVNGELRKCGAWTRTAGTFNALQSLVVDITDPTNNFVAHWPDVGAVRGMPKYPLGPVLPATDPNYADEAYWTEKYNDAVAAHRMQPGLTYGTNYPVAQGFAYTRELTSSTATTFPANVGQVVGDLCLEAGYLTTDFDTSQLDDMTVMGFVRTGIMAARDAINPLRQVCFFDGIESDGVLKFVARGQPNTFAFVLDDLGAMIASGESSQPTARISTVKQLETDLPRRVTVTYLSQARDYQTNNQASPVRVNTRAVNETAIQLPMVLDDSQALAIATALWAQAWVERWTHSIVVSGKRQELEPADCGTIPLDGLNVRVRITDIQDSLPATRQLSCTRDESANYSVTRVAGVPVYTPQPIRITTPVIAHMLDLPSLRDEDNDAGFYFAAQSALAGNFQGAQLFRSGDSGASYQLVGAVTNEATIGTVVVAALPTDSFDILDGESVLTVTLSSGQFDSCTLEALLAESNALAVGLDGRWEIIQFMTAVQTGTKTWQLTNLLRGRRGTEQFIGTGAVGDTAVLVSGAGIGRASMQITGVGKSLEYRMLGSGQSIDQVSDFFFTGHGTALKPFSPVQVGGAQDPASGDWTISWVRRGRIGGTLQSGTDIALSEDTQDFEVDILNGATVVRTISSSLESCVYNRAAQVTDFGAQQDTLSLVVYQVSAQVGRGYGTAVTSTH